MSRVRLHGSTTLPDHGFAYSATVGPGPLVFTAGISPVDGQGIVTTPGDVVGQTRQCLQNLAGVLAERGASLADVVKLTVYVAERLQADLVVAWQEVAAEFGDPVPPAMMLGVTVLSYDDQLVEIEAIAAPQE
ncbi:RidA family protein [Gordonia rhizosphera]|uniref:RidA family protein n=1 Tax=Gordonia rhizosphera TaxID=83341 RepID=UPI00059167D9|nr:RidA family protein [Gordonia rhizosphera]